MDEYDAMYMDAEQPYARLAEAKRRLDEAQAEYDAARDELQKTMLVDVIASSEYGEFVFELRKGTAKIEGYDVDTLPDEFMKRVADTSAIRKHMLENPDSNIATLIMSEPVLAVKYKKGE